jgi:hypothetical protein
MEILSALILNRFSQSTKNALLNVDFSKEPQFSFVPSRLCGETCRVSKKQNSQILLTFAPSR